jgi:hypothetical protein
VIKAVGAFTRASSNHGTSMSKRVGEREIRARFDQARKAKLMRYQDLLAFRHGVGLPPGAKRAKVFCFFFSKKKYFLP